MVSSQNEVTVIPGDITSVRLEKCSPVELQLKLESNDNIDSHLMESTMFMLSKSTNDEIKIHTPVPVVFHLPSKDDLQDKNFFVNILDAEGEWTCTEGEWTCNSEEEIKVS